VTGIINTLKPNTIALVKHSKANYLIQYFLDHQPPQHTQYAFSLFFFSFSYFFISFNRWIFDAVADQIEEVSRDRVGCVIVKKCIDHAVHSQQVLPFFLSFSFISISFLFLHQFHRSLTHSFIFIIL
jgi:hypothetical protein